MVNLAPPDIGNMLLLLDLDQTAVNMCQSQLCEQIARQTDCGVRLPSPAMPHWSTKKTSVPSKTPRPRPTSLLMDLQRPDPAPELYHLNSEVGTLCRRRRRPTPALLQSPRQGRPAARPRPCSVIETSVTRETQSVELHHRVRRQVNAGIQANIH